MAVIRIHSGSDVRAIVTLRDSDGTIIDLSSLDVLETRVKLCNEYTCQEWTESPTGDEKQLTIEDAVNGKVSILIDRVWNKKWKEKTFKVYATVIKDKTGDPDYPDNKAYLGGELEELIKIEELC